MKKPIYEILSNDIETVEEMIDALMIAPKGRSKENQQRS